MARCLWLVQEAVSFTVGEFKEPLSVLASDGSLVPRMTSWTGIRFILAEVRNRHCFGVARLYGLSTFSIHLHCADML